MPLNRILLSAILLAGIFLYVLASFFAYPFADDFCFGWTAVEPVSFSAKFLRQYLHWNGRYTTDVFVQFHPLALSGTEAFQYTCAMAVIVTVLINFTTAHHFLKDIRYSIPFSLFFTLLFLTQLPILSEHYYWFVGIVNYALPQWLLTLLLIPLSKVPSHTNWKYTLLAVLLVVLALGCNEITALSVPLLFAVWWLYAKTNDKTYHKRILTTCIASSLAAAFVIFSPGNTERAANFHHDFKPFRAAFFAALQTARFSLHWLLHPASVISVALLMANAGKIQLRYIGSIESKWWAIFILPPVYLASFLPYLATGILGQHHTFNYVQWFFMVGAIPLTIQVSRQYQLHEHLVLLQSEKTISILLTTAAIVLLATGNSKNIITEYTKGNLVAYKNNWVEREQYILQNPDKQIMPLMYTTETFKITDARVDSTFWVNKCMQFYYTKTYIPRILSVEHQK